MDRIFTNDSGKWIVFGNKVDSSIHWVCEPGYIGMVDNDVEEGRFFSKEEADAFIDEITDPDEDDEL